MLSVTNYCSIHEIKSSGKNFGFFKNTTSTIFFAVIFLLSFVGCNKYKIRTFDHTFACLQDTGFPDRPTRTVHVILPPGYSNSENASKRYPSIYILHGFGSSYGSIERIAEITKQTSEILYKLNQIKEMIVVLPHSGTSLCGDPIELECGSFYRNSPITANYKSYILDELVDLIDNKYRTTAISSKRGITGFSMGGYGAIILTMESNVESFLSGHGRFSSVASHSGLLSFQHILDELTKPPELIQWWVDDYLMPAMEAAFSDGRSLDLEYNEETGEITYNPSVWRLWQNNNPLTFLNENSHRNPFRETALYIDCGEADELGLDEHAKEFVNSLDDLGISHYPSDPIYRIDVPDFDYISDILSGHLLIELRVGESLKFHSQQFYP